MTVPVVFARLFCAFSEKTEAKKKEDNIKQEKNTKRRGGDPNEATNNTRVPQTERTPVNKRQVAMDTARAYAPRATEGQGATTHNPRIGRTGVTELTRQASSRSGTPRRLV